jgi:hypothetical protein
VRCAGGIEDVLCAGVGEKMGDDGPDILPSRMSLVETEEPIALRFQLWPNRKLRAGIIDTKPHEFQAVCGLRVR